MNPDKRTPFGILPLLEHFTIDPPCCCSIKLSFASNVVILPWIWGSEPVVDVLQHFITCKVVSQSHHSRSTMASLANNSRFDLLMSLKVSCICSDDRSDDSNRLIFIINSNLKPSGHRAPMSLSRHLDLESSTFISERKIRLTQFSHHP
jgi:hypothetical protein